MNPFATRALGATGVQLTQLGFGGAPMGELTARLPEAEAIATVERNFSSSVRMVATEALSVCPSSGYWLPITSPRTGTNRFRNGSSNPRRMPWRTARRRIRRST